MVGAGSPPRQQQQDASTGAPAAVSEKVSAGGSGLDGSAAGEARGEKKSSDAEASQEKKKKKKKTKGSLVSRVRRALHLGGSGSSSDDASDDDDEAAGGSGAAVMTHIDPSQDTTDPSPFTHRPLVLASLVDPKSLEALDALGGVEGVLAGLKVDGAKGLVAKGEEMEERKRVYGRNVLPQKKTKGLLELMWLALQDKVLVSTRLWGKNG